MTPEQLIAALEWRYAVKKFDATRKIPAASWQALERALVLSPSSFGLQPWRFYVIDEPAVRERLVAASWKQRQVADASHLVVFAIKSELGAADVERFIDRTVEVRGVPKESLAGYQKVILQFLSHPGFDVDTWSMRQLYIALGNFMTAAAMIDVDTCPLEGLSPPQYDEILGLPAQGYRTVVACAAGYRAADDKYADAKKVRFAHDEMVRHV